MSALLLVTALAESLVGLALLIAPSLVASVLLGVPLETSAGTVLARIAGAALVALGLVCWFAREDPNRVAVRGLVKTLIFYNVASLAILLHAHFGLTLSGIGFWPAVAFHSVLAGWCLRLLSRA